MSRAGLLSLCLAVSIALNCASQEPPKPSPEHALVKKSAGNWDATMKMMGQEFKAAMSTKMLGEFWACGVFEGEFAGMKFTGHDTLGYDPIKKRYIQTWIDSLAPNHTVMHGQFDEKTKTLTMEGDGYNMMGQPCKNKTTMVWKSDDEKHFTMMVQNDGKWETSFVIEYKRKK